MISDQDIDLNVPFSQKDKAKQLGARWNGVNKTWFIPKGTNITGFQQWLPKKWQEALDSGEQVKTTEERFGQSPDNYEQLTIADYIGNIQKAVLGVYKTDVWLIGQITSVKTNKSMTLIELMDPDQVGASTAAKVDGKVFMRDMERIRQKLKIAGVELTDGMTVRVKVKTDFNPKYHLGVQIIDIDPAATVGQLEMQLRLIREQLKKEGVFNANKKLPSPADYYRVAVIHPAGASGMHDFRQDADILDRLDLVKFGYVEAVFEGGNAESSIMEAMSRIIERHNDVPMDAVVIIRGGGSKQGLYSLSTEKLARMICECPLPVITGIGHADDDTLLDEVSWRRCDTPSKVIAFIRDMVRQNVYNDRQIIDRLSDTVMTKLDSEKLFSEQALDAVIHNSKLAIQKETHFSASTLQSILSNAKLCLRENKTFADNVLQNIQQKSLIALTQQNAGNEQIFNKILDFVKFGIEQEKAAISHINDAVTVRAREVVSREILKITQMQEMISALGPEKTLKRGYALATDENGHAIMDAALLRGLDSFILRLRDGEVKAAVVKK